MTDEEANKILNIAVAAFLARNRDLAETVHKEVVLYGAISSETAQLVADRMDQEASISDAP